MYDPNYAEPAHEVFCDCKDCLRKDLEPLVLRPVVWPVHVPTHPNDWNQGEETKCK